MRGPTLIKHLLNSSSMSNLLVKMLLFIVIVILEGEVRPIVFRLFKSTGEVRIAFKSLLSRLNCLR